MYSSSVADNVVRIGAAFAGSSSLVDAFNRARLELYKAVNRFTARYKRLPELEAQVKAIGVYALKATPGSAAKKRLVAEYAAGEQNVEKLKAQAQFIRDKAAEAMAEVQRVAQALGLTRGGGVGAIQTVVVPVVILAAAGAAIAWSLTFDKQAKNNADVLAWAQKQNWTPKQTKEVLDAMNQAGANWNPKAFADLLGGVSSAVVVGALLVMFGPTLWRAINRRRASRRAA